MLQLAGIHAIVATPFDRSGASIEHGVLAEHVDRLIRAGVTILVADGNTSEYHSLSPAERRAALRTIADTAGDRALVVAGVGAVPAEAGKEGRDARDAGARALMVHTPPSPFQTPAGWLRYHDDLADATGMPLLPYVRGAAIDPGTIAVLARRPSVAAIKYAIPDVIGFGTAVSLAPDATHWICGLAESWAPAFAAHGSSGFTSGLVNVHPEIPLAFHRALTTADPEAVRGLWSRIRPFELLRARDADGYNVSVIKAALRLRGIEFGPVRPPASDIPESFLPEIERALALLGG